MRQITTIAATVVRLLAVGFAVWAGLKLAIWATNPVAIRIYTSGHESTTFDFSDIRELSEIAIYLIFAAALYAISLPVARAATPDPDTSVAFSVAFVCIRTAIFSCIVIGLLSVAFIFLEIPIDHIRRPTEEPPASFWAGSSFRLRSAFSTSVLIAFFLPFWIFARRISDALTRRFN